MPGVWSWAQSPSSVLSSYASIRGASSFGLSYPKIYIDGIEVANPLLVSRFAPEPIDHIEVIRGPQGSALYGTDAISGVVNIVTRHEGVASDGDTRFGSNERRRDAERVLARRARAGSRALVRRPARARAPPICTSAAAASATFIPNGYSRDFLANGSARFVGEHSRR